MNLRDMYGWMQDRIATKMPCGIGDVPSTNGNGSKPYAMIQGITASADELAFMRNAMHDEIIQVSSVGNTAEQALWAQEMVREVLQNTTTFPAPVVGCIMDSGGALVREDDVTYRTSDTFRVKVSI